MLQKFLDWLKKKTYISERKLDSSFHVSAGEVWWCSLGENIGVEMNGKGEDYLRPVLVFKYFNKNHIWVLPISSQDSSPFHLKIPSQPSPERVVISQIRTVSTLRLYRYINKLNVSDFHYITDSFMDLLKYRTPVLSDEGSSRLSEMTDLQTSTEGVDHIPYGNNRLSIYNNKNKAIDIDAHLYDNDSMNQEYEVKFLDIDVEKLEQKLVQIGAEKVGEYFYRRISFDFPDLRLAKEQKAWVRLRDEGDRVTFTWKRRLGATNDDGTTSDSGMEEIETTVGDFDETADILRKIGMKDKFYQENRRRRWKKGTVEFDIDSWPLLNPYLEIEAHSWEAIDLAIREIGFNPEDKKIYSTGQIYTQNGINEMDYLRMSFTELVKKPL